MVLTFKTNVVHIFLETTVQQPGRFVGRDLMVLKFMTNVVHTFLKTTVQQPGLFVGRDKTRGSGRKGSHLQLDPTRIGPTRETFE